MLAKLHTFSLLGIDALPVEVEVDVSPGALPKTVLVGLPEQAVKESLHRIERAMVNSGFVRPQDRVVINLARPNYRRAPGRSICRSQWASSLAVGSSKARH
jgi:magnesium chelatase family protein